MTDRFNWVDTKFQPHAFNIPLDRKELEGVIDRLYQLMFPISSITNVEIIHAKLTLVADCLLKNISKLPIKILHTKLWSNSSLTFL